MSDGAVPGKDWTTESMARWMEVRNLGSNGNAVAERLRWLEARIAELEAKQHEEGRATVYLSRRNLLTLLNKLDRKKGGEWSACGLVKSDTVHAQYPCSHLVYVYAVEDEDYYDDREAGPVHPSDDPDAEVSDE